MQKEKDWSYNLDVCLHIEKYGMPLNVLSNAT